MRDRARRSKGYIIAGSVFLLLLLALLAGTGRQEVMVAEAFVGSLDLRVATSGMVESDGADLAFQLPGEVASVYVREGDSVAKSQLLARLLPGAAASVPPGALDVIQAPYDGTVVYIYVIKGSIVAAGQPVLRVLSTGPTWVTAFVDSEDAAYIKPGQEFRSRAGGYLSQPSTIVVRSVGKEAVPRPDLPGSPRQVRVRCDIVSGDLSLPPGTEVDIDGEVPLMRKALLIPVSAVVRNGARDWVWVIENSRAYRREVQLGPNNFDLIHVAAGIRPGDEVVVQGKDGLKDGQRVKVKPMPGMAHGLAGDD